MPVKPARRLLLLATVATLGCSEGVKAPPASDSMTKATVSGTVTVKGKPMKVGTVIFNPANARRKDVAPVSVKVEDGGKYKLETYVGTNAVQVDSREGGAAAGSGFSNAFDVKEGENTYDIEVVR